MKAFFRFIACAIAVLLLGACTAPAQQLSSKDSEPLTLATAVNLALANNPKLQGQLGWINKPQDVIELTAQVRKAWIMATASEQVAQYMRQVQQTTHASQELAQRMVKVGNWSELKQAQEKIHLLEAQAQLIRASQAAAHDKEKLAKLMGLDGITTSFSLPEQLPDLPAQAMTLQDAQAKAAYERLNVQNAVGVEARQTFIAYETSYKLAKQYRDELVPLRKRMNEEMVLRYNGMLVSVWDLLADTREQIQSMSHAIEAQRDFWLADADLQMALTGTQRLLLDAPLEQLPKTKK